MSLGQARLWHREEIEEIVKELFASPDFAEAVRRLRGDGEGPAFVPFSDSLLHEACKKPPEAPPAPEERETPPAILSGEKREGNDLAELAVMEEVADASCRPAAKGVCRWKVYKVGMHGFYYETGCGGSVRRLLGEGFPAICDCGKPIEMKGEEDGK